MRGTGAWVRSVVGRPAPPPPGLVRTPLLAQVENGDCGAACLGIVMAYHGCHVPSRDIREVCGTSRNGLTAATLIHAAARYGLRGTGKRVVIRPGGDTGALLSAVARITVPAIVLLGDSHFVVLEGVAKDGHLVVNDPAVGRRVLGPSEFAESFSRLALTFTTTPGFNRVDRSHVRLRVCARWLAEHRSLLICASFAGLVAGLLTGGGAMLAGRRIDTPALGIGADRCALALLGVAVAVGATAWGQRRIAAKLASRMAALRRRRVLDAILAMPAVTVQQRLASVLVEQLQFVDNAAALLSHRCVAVCFGLPALMPVIVVMAGSAGLPTAMAMTGAVVGGLVRYMARRQGGDQRRRISGLHGGRRTVLMAGFSGGDRLHAQGAEWHLFDALAEMTADDIELRTSAVAASRWWQAAATCSEWATVLAVLWLTTGQSAAEATTDGAVLGFLMAFAAFLLHARSAVDAAVELPAMVSWLDDFDRLIEARPPDTDSTGADADADADDPAVPPLTGLIELEHVDVGYDPHQPPVLKDATVRIAPGQWVAVVGAAGSGKSTLLRTVAGVLRPWHGSVLLDGRATPRSLTDQSGGSVGYVSACPFLFRGTVAQNVTLWDDGISGESVDRAITDACLDEFLVGRGGSRHMRVEADGRNLSAGQRHRVALARALARDPSVLLLDEAPGAPEPRLAARVRSNLRNRGTTVIAAVSDAAAAEGADMVLELRDGRLSSYASPARESA